MEDIRIDDLDPGDAELFSDDESFMDELAEDELGLVAGGVTPTIVPAASTVSCAAGIGASIGAAAGAIGSLFD